MKKAFLFLANGFEDVEALTPIDYLRRAGIDLITVGVGGKTIVSSHKVPITCDIVLEEALQTDGDLIAVVLPGGLPNSSTLAGSEAVREFAIVAAICAAPALALGSWGLLEGKNYTCYPGMGQDLSTKPKAGERVIRDGNIITACAAGAAEEFAFAIVEAICGKTALNKLKTEVVAR